eukprot:1161662-Pelagomonas_calceolata.AAC.2
MSAWIQSRMGSLSWSKVGCRCAGIRLPVWDHKQLAHASRKLKIRNMAALPKGFLFACAIPLLPRKQSSRLDHAYQPCLVLSSR